MKPYVVAGRDPVKAEGWAHVMDRQRCTACAVAGFAQRGAGEITAGADGLLRIVRTPAGAGVKQLRFWLHSVTMPVQVGARTSPQAMLAPLEVTAKPMAP